jgi:hypothetical protein
MKAVDLKSYGTAKDIEMKTAEIMRGGDVGVP